VSGEITIRRIDHKSYEITRDGKAVTISRNDMILEFPRCFQVIDQLYPAAKCAFEGMCGRPKR